jgi:4-hydroxybenzoate polyprenyltransferase
MNKLIKKPHTGWLIIIFMILFFLLLYLDLQETILLFALSIIGIFIFYFWKIFSKRQTPEWIRLSYLIFVLLILIRFLLYEITYSPFEGLDVGGKLWRRIRMGY